MSKEETLEELYGITSKKLDLIRVQTKSGKWLEVFKSPYKAWGDDKFLERTNRYKVEIEFPEFTCLCPKTSHPDFATMTLRYIPNKLCVELKALKYYLNSFRNEGHFHEQVTNDIYTDLDEALKPVKLQVVGRFNVRGGTYPVITVGESF